MDRSDWFSGEYWELTADLVLWRDLERLLRLPSAARRDN